MHVKQGPELWWQYHLLVTLLQFWLVILSALLIRHGTEMTKERGD
jgi:hypothetical protein